MTDKIKTPSSDDFDIPESLRDICDGMVESRILEKLALTERIVEVTGLEFDSAFEKATAAITSKPTDDAQ